MDVHENGQAGRGAADEEFHEETPQEFANQPDRDFARMPAPGEDSAAGDAHADDAGIEAHRPDRRMGENRG